MGGFLEHYNISNDTIWSGILAENNTKVTWKNTGHSIPHARHATTGFCIDNNIYLPHFNCDIGLNGRTGHCDRYDLKTRKYDTNVFLLSSR